MKYLVAVLAALMIAVALPLAMGRVPPNWFYGFRTAKTMSDSETWYRANRAAGINLVVAGSMSLVIWAGVLVYAGAAKAGTVCLPVFLVLLISAVLVSFVQLYRM